MIESLFFDLRSLTVSLEELEQLLRSPPIMCDICNSQARHELGVCADLLDIFTSFMLVQVAAAADVWTCENGRRTVLHAVAYDVCQAGAFLLCRHVFPFRDLRGAVVVRSS